jgi:hypothetical protein
MAGVADYSARLTIVLFTAAAAAMIVTSVALSQVVGPPEPDEKTVIIPAGTAERIASGEDVDIIPADLEFRLRDRLVVVNNDSASHQIGPFVVPPSDRLETVFSEAATVDGYCSLHSSGRITIHIGDSS